MFSPRRVSVGGRTYEADADGKVYSVDGRQRRRVRDPQILRQIDQRLRGERAALEARAQKQADAEVEAEARRAGREAARRAIQAAAAIGAAS